MSGTRTPSREVARHQFQVSSPVNAEAPLKNPPEALAAAYFERVRANPRSCSVASRLHLMCRLHVSTDRRTTQHVFTKRLTAHSSSSTGCDLPYKPSSTALAFQCTAAEVAAAEWDASWLEPSRIMPQHPPQVATGIPRIRSPQLALRRGTACRNSKEIRTASNSTIRD